MLLLLPLGEANRKRRGCARKITPQPDKQAFAFTTPLGLVNPMTRTHVRLLGPCFKTGRRQRRSTRDGDVDGNRKLSRCTSPLRYPPVMQPRARGLKNRSFANFTQVCGARLAVRRVKHRRNTAVEGTCNDDASLRMTDATANTPPSLNLQHRLRDCLRLPLHSFTYF